MPARKAAEIHRSKSSAPAPKVPARSRKFVDLDAIEDRVHSDEFPKAIARAKARREKPKANASPRPRTG